MGSVQVYEDLNAAKRASDRAERELVRVKRAVEEFEMNARKSLTVGQHCPCRVAVLPDDSLVVHVWVESSSHPNQLYRVPVECMNSDGKLQTSYRGMLERMQAATPAEAGEGE